MNPHPPAAFYSIKPYGGRSGPAPTPHPPPTHAGHMRPPPLDTSFMHSNNSYMQQYNSTAYPTPALTSRPQSVYHTPPSSDSSNSSNSKDHRSRRISVTPGDNGWKVSGRSSGVPSAQHQSTGYENSFHDRRMRRQSMGSTVAEQPITPAYTPRDPYHNYFSPTHATMSPQDLMPPAVPPQPIAKRESFVGGFVIPPAYPAYRPVQQYPHTPHQSASQQQQYPQTPHPPAATQQYPQTPHQSVAQQQYPHTPHQSTAQQQYPQTPHQSTTQQQYPNTPHQPAAQQHYSHHHQPVTQQPYSQNRQSAQYPQAQQQAAAPPPRSSYYAPNDSYYNNNYAVTTVADTVSPPSATAEHFPSSTDDPPAGRARSVKSVKSVKSNKSLNGALNESKAAPPKKRQITVQSVNAHIVWIDIAPNETGAGIAEKIQTIATYKTKKVLSITTASGRNIALNRRPLFDGWADVQQIQHGEQWTVEWGDLDRGVVDRLLSKVVQVGEGRPSNADG